MAPLGGLFVDTAACALIVPEDDVTGWLYCEKAPDATAVIRLVAYLGADFATELLSLAGVRCMAGE